MSGSAATSLAITNPLVKYRSLVATKAIQSDPAQHRLALHLAKLYERLKDYEPELEYRYRLDQISRTFNSQRHSPPAQDAPSPPPRQSTWRSLLNAKQKRDSLALTRKLTSHESALQMSSPKGLMLHGEVGTGKSMLIDLFADCLPTRKKRRRHFNTFMLETLAKLEALRADRARHARAKWVADEDDYSLLWLAKDMVQTSPILFLDEFQMPDRVASKILTNLMTGFFQLGGVLVATSNRMPEELAKAAGMGFGGEIRDFGWFRKRRDGRRTTSNEFAGFLEVLRARCEVWEMEGGKDWRRVGSTGVPGNQEGDLEGNRDSAIVLEGDMADEMLEEEGKSEAAGFPQWYNVLSDPTQSDNPLEAALLAATDGQNIDKIVWTAETLHVYGRKVDVPRAYNGISMWTFEELCKATFGPADYITLASNYHTLLLTNVPVLNWLMKNEARRFITLLDALYECRCKLFVSAAAGPDDIFFPEEQKRSRPDEADKGEAEGDSSDAVYSETLSEVYQDATAPFRPNILMQNPNYAEPDLEPDYTHARLAGLLRADALEDDAPASFSSRERAANSGSSSSSTPSQPFARSFGRTDAEMERAPIDPDGGRPSSRPDFSRTSAFTGEDERFAYRRAQSRLWEMCSARWWCRSGEGWHRPTPEEVRGWERVGLEGSGEDFLEGQRRAETEVRMGGAVVDESRDERSFKRVERMNAVAGGQEARQDREPPKKIGWTHFWGTIKWPRRAGPWGQGPDGLKDRKP